MNFYDKVERLTRGRSWPTTLLLSPVISIVDAFEDGRVKELPLKELIILLGEYAVSAKVIEATIVMLPAALDNLSVLLHKSSDENILLTYLIIVIFAVPIMSKKFIPEKAREHLRTLLGYIKYKKLVPLIPLIYSIFFYVIVPLVALFLVTILIAHYSSVQNIKDLII